MVEFSGQRQEQKELESILQSLLQINGSLKRLDLETEDFYITLPSSDWNYLTRIIEQNKTSKVGKFYSKDLDSKYFKLGNIKVVCGGIV